MVTGLLSFAAYFSYCTRPTHALYELACGSTINSQLRSDTNDDFYLNVSSNNSTRNDNATTLTVSFITAPTIPIEIYFSNATAYDSCLKYCTIHGVPVRYSYILRLNKYLDMNGSLDYSLHINCSQDAPSSTLMYTTTRQFDYYSLSFSQDLSFGNRNNILSFTSSALIVVAFLSLSLNEHRKSDRPELQFLSHRSNMFFYVCANITLFVSIMMCRFAPVNKYVLGILVALTLTSINFASVIGMKYYSSYVHNYQIGNSNLTLARLSRYACGTVGVAYLVFYYVAISVKELRLDLVVVVRILVFSELFLLSLASFASKTAQIQWLILSVLIWWVFDSEYDEIFFSFFWYSVFCVGCAVSSIFIFSDSHSKYLTGIFVKILGSFLSVLDLATDVAVIVIWIGEGLYFWVVMQCVFIFSNTVYSALYIDDYYFIDWKQRTMSVSTSERAKRLCWGRLLTLLGFGRVYHAMFGWDNDKNKDMDISNRVLKIWEMIFESFPTIILQVWISLYTELDVVVVLSLFVGVASISFTFLRILYGDHNSDDRNEGRDIAVTLRARHVSPMSQTLSLRAGDITTPRAEMDEIKEEKEHKLMDHQEEDPQSQAGSAAAIQAFETAATSGGHGDQEAALSGARCGSNVFTMFVCCYPVKFVVDHCRQKDDDNDAATSATDNDDDGGLSLTDKLIYFIFYGWVMSDFFVRIFPVLVVARLREEYLEFLAVMLGLTVFEFFGHFLMLKPEFRSPRNATKFFWTLYFTNSYCLLSTLYLVYLVNNVIFDRLLVEHCLRLIIQAGFMSAAMIMQQQLYGNVLGFFDRSIVVFWIILAVNAMFTFVVHQQYHKLEGKFKLDTEQETNVVFPEPDAGNGRSNMHSLSI